LRAMLFADIEPDAITAVAHKPASFQDCVTAQDQFVAAGLPAAVEAFGVIVLHQALGEQQLMGTVRAKSYLPVVPENTPPDDLVFAGKGRAAGVHAFDRAVLQSVMA